MRGLDFDPVRPGISRQSESRPSRRKRVGTRWLADRQPARVTSGAAGRFVIVPDSRPNEVGGRVLVEAAGTALLVVEKKLGRQT
ncbi:MAG TPA: hypothetical protein VKD72_38985 [Gemmataceae bacterium]|nr:hypothetical protein [Gemmataceae bacterium]